LSKYIALDVGTKRIGIALSDDLAIIASPFKTISREGGVNEVVLLAETEKAARIVVGLPYLPSGGLGSQAVDVQQFADELRQATSLPIDFENEVLTSIEAENRLKSLTKRRLVKAEIDAMAACVILESYMNRTK
jgi:putative holliday junction resolvase